MIDEPLVYRNKEQVLFDLAMAFPFSPESLEENREGRLSAKQFQQLSVKCYKPALIALVFFIAPLMIWTGLIANHEGEPFLGAFSIFLRKLVHFGDLVEERGKLGAAWMAGSTLGGVLLSLLISSRISMSLVFDLLGRQVDRLEGRVTAREEQINRANGRDPIERYFFSTRSKEFQVTAKACRALESGAIYLMYVLPRSQRLVSLEPKVGSAY